MRYLLNLAYNGSKFHGWQKQPNAITLQETIENAINTILRDNIELIGCGRTDTGVHAKSFYAHFDSSLEFSPKELLDKLNSFLDKQIAIYSISEVEQEFHARFSARQRTYEYYITTTKNPFLAEYSWFLFYNLNLELMQQALNLLKQYSDFTSFSKLHTDVKTNNCNIYEAIIIKTEHKIIVRITADRFLRNMVRAIVGTIVDVGINKINLKDFENIIISKNRSNAGQSAPAKGLFLVDVTY